VVILYCSGLDGGYRFITENSYVPFIPNVPQNVNHNGKVVFYHSFLAFLPPSIKRSQLLYFVYKVCDDIYYNKKNLDTCAICAD